MSTQYYLQVYSWPYLANNLHSIAQRLQYPSDCVEFALTLDLACPQQCAADSQSNLYQTGLAQKVV